MEFDVVLRAGTVIDGGGGPEIVADVGITGERVTAVGDLAAASGTVDLDVSGRVVAPGFIDVHAHTDLSNFLSDDQADVKLAGLRQGVTTEVCGNCGSSPFPAPPPELVSRDPYLGLMPEGVGRSFGSLADYREAVGQVPLGANLAPLLGHNALRASVVGYDDRSPTADERHAMRRGVARAMEDGAFGFSTGLIYPPGVYSQTAEIIELAAVAGAYDRVYASHMRDEADHLETALDEALRIGREAGAGVEISHHKAAGRPNWGKSQRTLSMISRARAGGLDVTIDVYPYTAGSTWLAALLPPWANAGGRDALLDRLRDPASRARIAADYEQGIPGWQNLIALSGWDSVVLTDPPAYAGRSVAELAEDAGLGPVDFVAELLGEHPGTIIVIHMMDAGEVTTLGRQPFALVGSDGVPLPGQQHPRLAGTFARLLRQAADEDNLPDLVRRASGLAADKFAIPDRGYVAKGKVADLVVFDPATVRDRSTYPEPWLPPDGVDHVLVAGELVIRDGADTGTRRGTVLAPA